MAQAGHLCQQEALTPRHGWPPTCRGRRRPPPREPAPKRPARLPEPGGCPKPAAPRAQPGTQTPAWRPRPLSSLLRNRPQRWARCCDPRILPGNPGDRVRLRPRGHRSLPGTGGNRVLRPSRPAPDLTLPPPPGAGTGGGVGGGGCEAGSVQMPGSLCTPARPTWIRGSTSSSSSSPGSIPSSSSSESRAGGGSSAGSSGRLRFGAASMRAADLGARGWRPQTGPEPSGHRPASSEGAARRRGFPGPAQEEVGAVAPSPPRPSAQRRPLRPQPAGSARPRL